VWLPEPAEGTSVCLGFDGSDFDDWTALRAETRDGLQFTPRYGPDRLPTIWNPKESPDQRTPRLEVAGAIAECFERYDVRRFYCDPPRFETDIDQWDLEFGKHPLTGEDRVIQWPTYRPKQMHEALERFVSDLAESRISQDGCPITTTHMANARKLTRGMRYVIGKPNDHQKIDAAMASVLAHEAAADERAAGWPETSGPSIFFLS
jgi:hypothetical protein